MQTIERDRKSVWHPYSAPESSPLFEVVQTEGVHLTLASGKKLVDGMSSWWAAIHGYRNAHIEEAVTKQLQAMPHIMFGGLTHEPAVALCERLIDWSPGNLSRVFLSDSGSVAVEVAIKTALQYWMARGEPLRQKLLTLLGGYHGDTFATMAVCDPVNGMHDFFRGNLQEHFFAERPTCRYDERFEEQHISHFSTLLGEHQRSIAAVILEPIVQGAGGMWFYSPQFLARIRELCSEIGVPLILDEIATGFGRTGRLFGANHADVEPDIMCLGKALTGGTLSLAATLVSEEICETIGSGQPGILAHGPTFMGNPLACAAAGASLDLMESTPWRERVIAIEDQLRRELEPCRELPGVSDVRTLGAIGVVELDDPVDMGIIQPAFVEEGVWIRPFGKLVYLMPPFIISPAELSRLTAAIHSVLSRHHCGRSH
ncbi:MAG: adenosylmethionine--8-amino-7-oxononanoate transaminase [Myxococcota bacterium]|nr:adenosylmethionine--8-amino-7-oxononanoate transaminase [Myxococcota bacterium]